MRKKKIITLLIFSAISLVASITSLGCNGLEKESFIKVLQNANIDNSQSELTEYVHHTNSEEVLYLLDNNESFLFYVGLDNCSGCQLFKPNLIQYVQETKALIYYLNAGISEDYLAYADIWYKYQNIFEPNLEVPYLLFIKNQTTFQKGAVSKMTSANYQTFLTMMNQLVTVSSIRLWTSFDKIENVYNNSEPKLFIFYSRVNESNRLIYQAYLLPFLLKQEKNTEIVDLLNFSGEDTLDLKDLFLLPDEVVLCGAIVQDQTIMQNYVFSENNTENDAFLNLYFSN